MNNIVGNIATMLSSKDRKTDTKISMITKEEYNIMSNKFRFFHEEGSLSREYKAAGIIPYCKVENENENEEIKFLLTMQICQEFNPANLKKFDIVKMAQSTNLPKRGKKNRLVDFGGKKDNLETDPLLTAIREFLEETGCIYYYYLYHPDIFTELTYTGRYLATQETLARLPSDIITATNYLYQTLSKKIVPSMRKGTYLCYFLQVPYLPADFLPPHEDLHIDYQFRFPRVCVWLSATEIGLLTKGCFHCRIDAPLLAWTRNMKNRKKLRLPNLTWWISRSVC